MSEITLEECARWADSRPYQHLVICGDSGSVRTPRNNCIAYFKPSPPFVVYAGGEIRHEVEASK